MGESIRWTVRVSKTVDMSLREFLGRRGAKRGERSKFIEDAVRRQIFVRTASETKSRNAAVPLGEIESVIDEALAAARDKSGPET